MRLGKTYRTTKLTKTDAGHAKTRSKKAYALAPPGYGIELIDRAGAQMRAERAAPVQRKAAGRARGIGLPSDGGGKAMPRKVQAKMEGAFGTDFSAVRIYEGPRSEALGALAYTQGRDIHFAPGEYRPGSRRGQEILGHELTHVVQQSQRRVSATTQANGVAVNDDAGLEREADVMGARAGSFQSAALKSLHSPLGTRRHVPIGPVQMVKENDEDKKAVARQVNPDVFENNNQQKQTAFTNQCWIILTKSVRDTHGRGQIKKLLHDMSVDDAAKLVREKKSEVLEAHQEQEQKRKLELTQPPKLKNAIPTEVTFNVPNLGSGRIIIYTVDKASTQYQTMLAWVSHGIQITNGKQPAKGERAFAGVVKPGKALLRPGRQPEVYRPMAHKLNETKEKHAFKDETPDMGVGPHGAELTAQDEETLNGLVPLCDIAVVIDFTWAEVIDEQYQELRNVEVMPLNAVLDHTKKLQKYDTYLMLCCRSSLADIQAKRTRDTIPPQLTEGGELHAFSRDER